MSHNAKRQLKQEEKVWYYVLSLEQSIGVFFLELKLFTEHTASLHSSEGLCVMAILRYAFLRYAFLCYAFLCYAVLRYASLHYSWYN